MMTGLFAGFALLSGVIAARKTGTGRDIDVNLFDCALQNLNYLATWYLNENYEQRRETRSSHPSLTPSQLYRTRDGYIFIMCNKEKFWPILCDLISRPDLASDPHFRTFKERLANRDQVTELLDAALEGRTTAEWLEHFAGRVPAAPVNDIASALNNPFVREQGRIWNIAHPTRGDFRMLAAPFSCPGDELPRKHAPQLGQDTDEILTTCGFSSERIEALRRSGVI
jgi:succinate---hydroxymethylglutarate CoA-transferase